MTYTMNVKIPPNTLKNNPFTLKPEVLQGMSKQASDRSKVIALGDQKYACFISCFTSFRLSGDGIIFVGKKGNG